VTDRLGSARPGRTLARHRRTAAALAAVGVLGLSACANDDGDDAVASTGDAAETASEDATAEAALPAQQDEPEAAQSATRTISVTGQGSVSVRPDTSEVQVGVRVSGDSAQDVLDEANDRATEVIDALEAQDISSDDIRTTGLSVFPTYGPEGSEVTGYEASNSVTVTIRDIDRAGEVIDAAASAAGDAVTIDGISFSVADPEPALADARDAAVERAAVRAEELASAAGLAVGEVISISDAGSSTPGPVFAGDVAEAAVPIEPGSQQLTAQVTVVYELLDG
jgi:uncharacterized protein YggE